MSRPTSRRQLARHRRWFAYHEAGHAVAYIVTGEDLWRRFRLESFFERVYVRTVDELAAVGHAPGGQLDGPHDRYRCFTVEMREMIEAASARDLGPGPAEQIRAELRDSLTADLVTDSAGAAAEARVRKVSLSFTALTGGHDDVAHEVQRVRRYTRSREEQHALMWQAEQLAPKLVRTHWPAIERLAALLLAVGSVDGEEAERLVLGRLIGEEETPGNRAAGSYSVTL